MKVSVLIVSVLAGCAAFARTQDGLLDLVLAPNAGRPALITAGDSFDVHVRTRCQLFAERNGVRIPLDVEWVNDAAAVTGRAQLSADAEPGLYTLVAVDGEHIDYEARAIYVYREPEGAYLFGLLGSIPADDADERTTQRIERVVTAINSSPAAFLVITGPLTRSGTDDEFRALLNVLEAAEKPIFLIPGPPDQPAYARFFSQPTYYFTYAEDGYLVFDTSDALPAADGTGQAGTLQRLRRTIKPQRWSIGLTHRYSPRMGMRAQLTLLVDDPLSTIFVSEPSDADNLINPWSTSRFIGAPPLSSGTVLLVQARGDSIAPLPPVTLSELE